MSEAIIRWPRATRDGRVRQHALALLFLLFGVFVLRRLTKRREAAARRSSSSSTCDVLRHAFPDRRTGRTRGATTSGSFVIHFSSVAASAFSFLASMANSERSLSTVIGVS